ncbi:hypothetical protein DERP_002439 [Dermatophagoides pteronyssinus]|uniref:Uncharacterized protein n=1 Tax=Dermatophagoides pteronyssinus TaxID=6956 RepID=A0ABQ8JHT9_DERPT|nr:hypothetical protein DERP_002439 [Dermatophagoides pteronyssinus]
MNIIFSFILLLSLIRMIVAKNVVQDENPHKRIMIPYKSVYGVPRRCTGRSNHKTTEENYRICQINAIKKWKITFEHYIHLYNIAKNEDVLTYQPQSNYGGGGVIQKHQQQFHHNHPIQIRCQNECKDQ